MIRVMPRWSSTGEKTGRSASRTHPSFGSRLTGLLPAVILTVLLGALVATALTFLLTWLVLKVPPTGSLPTSSRDGSNPFLDILKVSLTVAAGIGGAVALVVSYRRQRLTERD